MTNLLYYLGEVSIGLAFFYLLYFLMLRKLTTFTANRFYLIFAIIGSFIIPIVSIDMYPIIIEPVQSSDFQVSNPLIDSHSEIAQSNFSPLQVLFYAYVTVAVLLLLRFIYNTYLIFQQAWSLPSDYNNQYYLVRHDGPATFSFFNYLFYPSSKDLDEEVIHHEVTHIIQKHSWDVYFSEITKIILWFNPFAYSIQKAIKLNHEYLSDQQASEIRGSYHYGQLLYNTTKPRIKPILVNNFAHLLKNRLIMLHKSSSSKKQLWVYTLVLPQLITLLHFFSFEKYYIPEVSVDNVTTDTIPYNIVEIETSDTVLVFDSDSKTEKLVYLKSSEKFVEHLDTNVVTDRVTGEKALIVNSTFIPLDEYKAAMKRIEYPKGQPNLDTIVLIDYDTFEETVSIIEPTHECFTFFWGNRAFSNSHKISLETFKKIFARDLTLTSTCNDQTIKSYEFRVVFIDKGKDALVLNITKAKQKIDQDFIKIENIKDGSIIFIEDITVNDQVSLPGIQIFIEN